MGKPTEEQRPVIENASANNMVIAAPGSGKSFTMIEAVISILKKYPYARIGMAAPLLALQQTHLQQSYKAIEQEGS
ncbi:hypothetical protein AXK30_12005 [Escherichia coli]|nr:hypothetical protein AXK30_12005 [Escherichia coli]